MTPSRISIPDENDSEAVSKPFETASSLTPRLSHSTKTPQMSTLASVTIMLARNSTSLNHLPPTFQHDGRQLTEQHTNTASYPPGEWVAGALVLLDLGFYDFWLFDRIDNNDDWFVSRVKSNTNFEVVDDLHRQEIDVRIELSFNRKRGSRTSATRPSDWSGFSTRRATSTAST